MQRRVVFRGKLLPYLLLAPQLAVTLMLAVMADRVLRGATVYSTILLAPYAIAPAVAGVLWLFLFNPGIGIVAYGLRVLGIDWNYLLNGWQALALVVIAAAWKQISYNSGWCFAGSNSCPGRGKRITGS